MTHGAGCVVRGTTPTITMSFKTINVANITEAWLTLTQEAPATLNIQKVLADASVGTKTLSWTLTQTETLAIDIKFNIKIQCRYLMTDGTAGASPIYEVTPYQVLKGGEIE